MAAGKSSRDPDPLDDYDPIGDVLPGPDLGELPPVGADPEGAVPVEARKAPARRRKTTVVNAEPPEISAGINSVEMSAEVAVLAAVLSSRETYDDIADRLHSDDFGAPAHVAIYAAIVACDASGRPFDPITVADEMTRAGTLKRAGGTEYLNRIVTSEPELEHLSAYVDIIIDRALRRRMVHASQIIGKAALSAEKDARSALEVAEHTVFELGQKRSGSTLTPMPTVVAQIHEEMAKARQAQLAGQSTGIDELDRITGGLRGGQLIVIAARPGMGKSVLGGQIARHIAQTSGDVVAFLSWEMSNAEIGFRLLASAADVELRKLLAGVIPEGKDRVIAHEAEKLAELPLLIDDHPPATIAGVRSHLRRVARRGRLGAVVLDYLQLMEGDSTRSENRTQEVSNISRHAKMMAKELDVPVIALSQLSRGLEARNNKRPMLSDLRESGAIEQDANLVLFIHRENNWDKAVDETHAELIVAKNRQGPQATIPLDWHAPVVRFDNSARTIDAPAGGPSNGGGFGAGSPGPGSGFRPSGSVTRPSAFL